MDEDFLTHHSLDEQLQKELDERQLYKELGLPTLENTITVAEMLEQHRKSQQEGAVIREEGSTSGGTKQPTPEQHLEASEEAVPPKKRGRPPKNRQGTESASVFKAVEIENQQLKESTVMKHSEEEEVDSNLPKNTQAEEKDPQTKIEGVEEQKELEEPLQANQKSEESGPAAKHIQFMLKAAHSLSKYHTKPLSQVRKATVKYFKQKEKRIRDAM